MIKHLYNSPYFLRTFAINCYGAYLYKKRFNKNYYSLIESLKENKSDSEIKLEQIKNLKNILIYSYENIEYYNEVFKKINFSPYEFNDTDDLNKIPILTKDIIRKNFDKLYNKKIKKNKYTIHSTSGSTGEKVKFYIPYKLLYSQNAAFIYNFYNQLGIKKGDRRVTIGGRVFTNKPPFWVYNIFENQLLLSSHHLSRQIALQYLIKIDQYKPKFIQGHPNSILYLAKEKLDKSYNLSLTLKGIFTTGETLLEDDRSIIEKAFNCIVLQQYGSGESCFSAYETKEKKGYKINHDHGYIELKGKEKYKEVIATSFLNPVMPLIRYKVGDLVRPVNINQSILFDRVVGRTDDILTDYYGNNILPVTIRMNLKDHLINGTNYQLIQINSDSYLINFLDDNKDLDVSKITQEIKKILGEKITLKIDYKKNLVSRGGKILNIINANK